MSSVEGQETRKNPFEPRQKTTIKRGKDEVYPQRKGLNRPQFMGNSPLDLLFQRLESELGDSLESVSVESLGDVLFPEKNAGFSPEERRYAVVERLLEDLHLIQEYSIEASARAPQKDLIAISLHDIKTFGKLVNLIILLGVYPSTAAFGIGVPIEKRRLNDFGRPSYKALKVEPIIPVSSASTPEAKFHPHCRLLVLLYEHLKRVFSTDSDVRNLLMKGSGYADFLVVAISLITVPAFPPEVRSKVAGEFETVAKIASSYELYQDYSVLIATPSPSYFRAFIMEKLQLLPSQAPRGDGVLTLIEFVLGLRDNDEINVEKFDHVASVLLSKPRQLASAEYFAALGTQFYDLLVNINRPTIATCVSHVIEKLWAKNPRIIQDFLLARIWRNFNPPSSSESPVLVSERDLNNNVNVLISLTNHGLPTDLLEAAFAPILVPFWEYYCFLHQNGRPFEVAQNILVSFFTQIGTNEDHACTQLENICTNLVVESEWRFRLGANQLVEICSNDSHAFSSTDPEKRVLSFMGRLDNNCTAFLALVEQLDESLTKKIFVRLLEKWVSGPKSGTAALDENPFRRLVDLRLLENIGDKFKDRLAHTPSDILQLVYNVLRHRPQGPSPSSEILLQEDPESEPDSDDEDAFDEDATASQEVVTVVLELLSAIISETQPVELDSVCRKTLTAICATLKQQYTELVTAQSLAARISMVLAEEPAPESELEIEKRALTRAITSLNDPLVPIRAHGLYLLRQLVEQKSRVISVDFAVNLHLVQLRDSDPFVYLNAIKGLDSLLDLDHAQVLPVLTAIYCGDDSETSPDLDERLRVGEVLLRYVQAQDEAFSENLARLVCEAALHLIRRPKNDADRTDDRLRMSAMSLLGTCCNTNPLGIMENLENSIDCAIGVLQLETAKDSAIMRRAAIVLIHDLISGTSKSPAVPFPREYMDKVLSILRYVQENDLDLLVREHAASVLQYIDDLVHAAVELET